MVRARRPEETPARPAGARRRRWWGLATGVACGLALVGAGALLGNVYVTRSIDGLGYDDPASVPHRTVAVVFGAGVIDGQPTPALSDRIDGAVALYRDGVVDHVLMTGDNSSVGYDEVTVMRDQAVARGVPEAAITRDHAGFNTYDSCVRARDVFGVRDAVLVTQDYHLARAMFTCREVGIDVVGLRVPDWQHNADRISWGGYPPDLARSYMAREWLARLKALLDTRVASPAPRFGGDFVGLVPN